MGQETIKQQAAGTLAHSRFVIQPTLGCCYSCHGDSSFPANHLLVAMIPLEAQVDACKIGALGPVLHDQNHVDGTEAAATGGLQKGSSWCQCVCITGC